MRWVLTDPVAANEIILRGLGPLPPQLIALSLANLTSVQCNGESVINVQTSSELTGPLIFLYVMNAFLLIIVLVLTALNLKYFSTLIINVIYTVIFSVGSILLLISLPFYIVQPTTGICHARIWFTGMGFSIVLGTMFSRTWQLREIYLLQKKQFDRLKGVSVASSLVKLIISMSVIVTVAFIFLAIWTGVDPYGPSLVITDHLNLVGEWRCDSKYLVTWISIFSFLVFILILFGIYVIYQTWSFQLKASMSETKWVLFALYNIVLNFAAVAPVLGFHDLAENDLAVVVCSTIIFSGGGIIFAVMLPRVLKLYGIVGRDSSEHHSSDNKKNDESTRFHQVNKKESKRGLEKTTKPEAPDISADSSHPKSVPLRINTLQTENHDPLTKSNQQNGGQHSRSRTPEGVLISRLASPTSYQYTLEHGFLLKSENQTHHQTPPSPNIDLEMEATPKQKPLRDEDELHFNLVDFSALDSPISIVDKSRETTKEDAL